jgi:hypothetical protein
VLATLTGQSGELPVHRSAGSQTPVDCRHSVFAATQLVEQTFDPLHQRFWHGEFVQVIDVPAQTPIELHLSLYVQLLRSLQLVPVAAFVVPSTQVPVLLHRSLVRHELTR